MGDLDTFMKEINTIVPITTEEQQDSALTLNSFVDQSTVKSLDSDYPLNTKQYSMDSEVLQNLAE